MRTLQCILFDPEIFQISNLVISYKPPIKISALHVLTTKISLLPES